jgi:hypothetical protein
MLSDEQAMSIAHIAQQRWLSAALRPLLLLLSLSLGGCVTTDPGSSVMDARAEGPAPAHVYLPVEVSPAGPSAHAMTTDEQAKLKKELLDARSRQSELAKAKNGSPQPGSAKPQ